MMNTLEKIKLASERPHRILPYLLRSTHRYFFPFLDVLGKTKFTRQVQGSKMEIDLSDGGLSLDLFINGYREPRTSLLYQNELQELKDLVDKVTVLDIGANVGYYALMAASILGDAGRIYAIEADSENVRKLIKNIKLNSYGDTVEVKHVAFGDTNGEQILYKSCFSNLHTLENIGHDHVISQVRVPIMTPSKYFIEHNIDPKKVNVIRMDIEGYEHILLPKLTEVLNTSSPLVIQMEIHPRIMNANKTEEVVSTLKSHDLDFVTGSQGWNEVASNYDDILRYNWVEVIARKNF